MSTFENSLRNRNVLNEEGASIAIEELWRESAIVLVFVRHFG